MRTILIIVFIAFSTSFCFAQKKYTVQLSNERQSNSVALDRSKRVMEKLTKLLYLNDTQIERIERNFTSLDQLLFFRLKNANYKLDPVLLKQKIIIKYQRTEMMENMLTEYQYSLYDSTIKAIEKKQFKSLDEKDPEGKLPYRNMLLAALAWDILEDELLFKD